ncbi:MAG: dTDP-4-dehydrorhamnose 3,5-epimerase [Mariprofundaceae bacterium]|nr:dTDP-4-dehydrorhamnose 3,5-epimerase [Mariprofundaceae bacterium]
MIFEETPLSGAYVVLPEVVRDERGFFARSWCSREFESRGLNPALVQCNISYNDKKGTLRGMHFQLPPHEEAKLVRCVRGSIFDVIIDLRPDSPTYCRWQGVELNEENRKALYIPEGFAHGFLTLTDDTEVLYQMSSWFVPDSAAGIRWDDPAIAIDWPDEPRCVSKKDRGYPDFVI